MTNQGIESTSDLAADDDQHHDAAALALAKAAPNMLAALKAIEPQLTTALKAYQFGASSYTYEALVACMKIRDIALAAIAKTTGGAS